MSTRNNGFKIYKQYSHLNARKHSFTQRVINDWNGLPGDINQLMFSYLRKNLMNTGISSVLTFCNMYTRSLDFCLKIVHYFTKFNYYYYYYTGIINSQFYNTYLYRLGVIVTHKHTYTNTHICTGIVEDA